MVPIGEVLGFGQPTALVDPRVSTACSGLEAALELYEVERHGFGRLVMG